MEYDAYLEMANGVVQQACEDYVNSQLKLMGIKKTFNEELGKYVYKESNHIYNEETTIRLRRMIRECIMFFKSDWCERLSPNYNGQVLINLLNDRVKDDVAAFKEYKEKILKKREEEKKTKRQKEIKEKPVLETKEYTQEGIEKCLGEFKFAES